MKQDEATTSGVSWKPTASDLAQRRIIQIPIWWSTEAMRYDPMIQVAPLGAIFDFVQYSFATVGLAGWRGRVH